MSGPIVHMQGLCVLAVLGASLRGTDRELLPSYTRVAHRSPNHSPVA
jgi:hypothetical protein